MHAMLFLAALADPASAQTSTAPQNAKQEINRRLVCQGLAIHLGNRFGLPDKPSPLRLQAYTDGEAIITAPNWGDAWPKGTQSMFAAALPSNTEQNAVRKRIAEQIDAKSEVEQIGLFNTCLLTYKRT